jgi:N-acetylmuramoyl-L-alanine amidase
MGPERRKIGDFFLKIPAALTLFCAFSLLFCASSLLFSQAPPAPHAPPPKFTVVLDPAHGGDDAGATLKSGEQEKALTLTFSARLRSLLGARGMQVVLTRESDTMVAADQRAEIADRAQAQACLSLHFTETGSGVHLFASDLPAAPPTHFLPWKTAQAAWVNRSLALTGALNSALDHAGLAVTLSRTALPGMDSMACPAVAIEIAPDRGAGRTGANEPVKAAVTDPNYQSQVAEALAAALLAWRAEAR